MEHKISSTGNCGSHINKFTIISCSPLCNVFADLGYSVSSSFYRSQTGRCAAENDRWVTPNKRMPVATQVGRRRVNPAGMSGSGHWLTGDDGKKVNLHVCFQHSSWFLDGKKALSHMHCFSLWRPTCFPLYFGYVFIVVLHWIWAAGLYLQRWPGVNWKGCLPTIPKGDMLIPLWLISKHYPCLHHTSFIHKISIFWFIFNLSI